jgi:hypothetical protein
MDLIKPKDLDIRLPDGGVQTFVISRLPATVGREIISKYPISNMPLMGDYKVSEETMLKLMSFVAVRREDGQEQRLVTRALVDAHIESWETLARLEIAMMEYNVSFFQAGKISNFSDAIGQKATAWITGTLIPLLQQSLQKDAPRSES